MARRKKNKEPKAKVSPLERKVPRVAAPPPTFRGGILSWRFNAADKNGPFAWSNLTNGDEFMAVIQKLTDIEPMSENDQQSKGCHFIQVEKLSRPAQDRLQVLQLDDLDEIYSIRLSGRGRVFCVHRPEYMRVLWFDPNHEVCPSIKKYT